MPTYLLKNIKGLTKKESKYMKKVINILFFCLFIIYTSIFLSVYYVPGIITNAGDAKVIKRKNK